jgi:Domain of unknown function (DUF4440)
MVEIGSVFGRVVVHFADVAQGEEVLRMTIRITVVACFLMLTSAFTQVQQTAQDEVLQATRTWLQNISKGDRAGLNAVMDARFIATTPAGDVIAKERLVPDDPAQAVQQLPALDLDGPIVRLYADTAVLMARLKSTAGTSQAMNGTFVYNRRDGAWKLVALHLSPQK